MKGINHDFCPNMNRYVYWLKKPIGWVVSGAIFSLLVGLLIGPQGYVLMWSFIALLVIGVAWPWLSMKGLSCKLFFEESRSEEDNDVHVILEITNRLPLPTFGLMLTGQFLQEGNSDDDQVAVSLRQVSAWSVCRFDWVVEPRRRGELPSQIPIISTGFPFGLYQIEKPVEVHGKTIVWPACQQLDGIPPLDGSQFNVDGTASDRAGTDGETIGVREYRHGDSIRNIHWNHTARCCRLIVKEKQSLTQMPVRIVVDLNACNHHGVGGQSTFEWAIRIAATVCKQLHQHQAQIELVCLGLSREVPKKVSNRWGLQPVLDFLALLPQYVPDLAKTRSELEQSAPIEDGKRFSILIHTKSFAHVPDSKQLKSICIDPDGFIETDELDDFHTSHWIQPEPNRTASIAITSPQTAAKQLSELWLGGLYAAH